jgi:hypothetical protein
MVYLGPNTKEARMSYERTRAIMERYWDADDPTALAGDAAYVFMATGERYVGRDAILAMMRRFYGETLAAAPEGVTRHVGDGFAMLESTLVGTHVGTFAGVAATGRRIRMPMCVTYRVDADAIVEIRAYLMQNVALGQVAD